MVLIDYSCFPLPLLKFSLANSYYLIFMAVAHIDYSCFPLPLPRSRDIELPHKHTQTGQVGICGHPDTLTDIYFAHRDRLKQI